MTPWVAVKIIQYKGPEVWMQEATVLVNAMTLEMYHFRRRIEGEPEDCIWRCEERSWMSATPLEESLLGEAVSQLTREEVM